MLEHLLERHPSLKVCKEEIRSAEERIVECYRRGGKLLLCGNGGSCADCDHIVGELMKGFLKKRSLTKEEREQMRSRSPFLSEEVLERLQGGLPAVSLGSFSALNTAFGNDVDGRLGFAQAVLSLGKQGDLLFGLSTSGNAENVLAAAVVAKGLGMQVLALTGEDGGRLKDTADCCIRVPERETFKVQELHLPVYHYLCAAVENAFF